MALPAGTRLGPYEITHAAGAGGMGEVYQARDTRLDRTVAVKILPADFVEDADRRQRFEREARVVASLSHPNICALYDIGSAAPPGPGDIPLSYLVMEYLEGETLADRLSRGALPLAEVIRFGSQIAMALHAAHRQHVVHRDLKPGNIMLTRAGVKLLDFGLAKTTLPVLAGGDSAATHSVSDVTVQGTVLGTLPYMAPEQVEGRPADWRSDIFAFGSVMYEMATGRRAFGGGSPASVASAILMSHPAPVTASPALDRIVRTCLEKDPDRRWQSALDIALQLEMLPHPEDPTGPKARDRRAWLPWSVAAAAAFAAIAAFAWGSSRGAVPPATGSIRGAVAFPLMAPDGGSFNFHSVEWVSFAVSPDGQQIAYAAAAPGSRPRVWLRSLASTEAKPIEGSEGAASIFWKPDSRSLAFFADDRLLRVDLPDGKPFTICTVSPTIGKTGTWGADGQILFSTVAGDVLQRVDATGGTPSDVRRPDGKLGEMRIAWPTFLPDGRQYLYLLARRNDTGSVMLAGPEGEPREVLRVKSNVQYVQPGYLLFVSDSTLVARRFDPLTGQLSGDTIVIAERVNYGRATGLAHMSASPTGVVAYQSHQDETRIAAFDRTGREVAQVMPTGFYQSVRLSPDHRRLLFDRMDPRLMTLDAWMLDLDRGAETRVTMAPTTEAFPIWGPDGTIIYTNVTGGSPHPVRWNPDTGAEEELWPEAGRAQWPLHVSADGQWLLYGRRAPKGMDLMARRFSDNTEVPFRTSDANELDGRFSPDGKFVAYVSERTGRPEVLVAPFPSGAASPVSTGGGHLPRWGPDGRELFYVGLDGELMTVPVRLTRSLDIGTPVRLFRARAVDGPWSQYDVAPGRIYAVVRTQLAAQQPLTVIVNWPSSVTPR